MKKIIFLIVVFVLISNVFVFAEGTEGDPVENTEGEPAGDAGDESEEEPVEETEEEPAGEEPKERTSEEVKELYSLRIKEILRMEDGEKALNELNRLKLQLEDETILSSIDLFDLNVEIEDAEDAIKEKIAKNSILYTEKELERLTTVEYSRGNFYIHFPRLENNQEYRYEVYKDKEIIKEGTTAKDVRLPDLEEESMLEVDVAILDKDYGTLLEASFKVEIKDDILPELIYAYIEDGEVLLKFEDDYRLNGELYNSEGEKIRIRNNKFSVDIPADINIEIVSPFGEKKEIQLSIDKDNYVIYGEVSMKIRNRLKDKRMIDLKKYDSIRNLFVGDKNGTIDLREESEHLVEDKYEEYNDEDISFSSDSIDINGILGELTKPGLNTVKINHSFYNREDLTFFIYVKDEDRVFNTNIDDVKIKGKIVTNKKTFTPKDYIYIEEKIEGYDPKLDFLFIIKDKMAYEINKEIELEEGIINKYKILNVLTNDEYYLNLKYEKEEFEENPVSFTDVNGSHWAYHDIKELAFAGLAKGYTDGSYKPDNNISIKEFMVLLNRFVSKANVEVESFNNDAYIPLSENDWAFLDVFSIYRRIKKDDLHKISITDINRKITRGEVAFLVDTSLKLDSQEEGLMLKDINSSIYAEHIYNLSNSKIINGYPDKTFRPLNNITRAEVSSILNKLLKESKGEIQYE